MGAPLVLDNVQSLPFIGPELTLGAGILLLLVWELVAHGARKRVGLLAIMFATLGAAGAQAAFALAHDAPAVSLFGGLLASDGFAHVFRVLFAFVTAVVALYAAPVRADDALPGKRSTGEMYLLLLTVALGLSFMAMSRHLLMIYLSIEIVSVISFVLAAFSIDDKKSSEGALKYVIYGGVASGIMLYGMSWLYGATQSLALPEIGARVAAMSAAQHGVPPVVFLATVCMLAGFGYKISAAPFHMWTPDVYEGAPTPVTAFLSVGPKAAGFAVLVRFFAEALRATGSLHASPWPLVAGVLAMLTMTVGNLSAIGQDNVKRMLAYSSIAHAGYMLLGFAVFSTTGTAAIVFYALTYCLMNLGAFLVVLALAEQNGGDESVGAFRGLGTRAPVLAACMAVFLFSLTGLPPFAGFVGKFYLFAALVRGGGNFTWLVATVGVLNSVVSLFYYARVLRSMYLTPAGASDAPVVVARRHTATAIALAVPTVALGVYWAPLYDLVARTVGMVP